MVFHDSHHSVISKADLKVRKIRQDEYHSAPRKNQVLHELIEFDSGAYPEVLTLTASDDGIFDLTQHVEYSQRMEQKRSSATDSSTEHPSVSDSSSSTTKVDITADTTATSSQARSSQQSQSNASTSMTSSGDSAVYSAGSVSSCGSIQPPEIPSLYLRPVPDLSTLFSQLIPIIGDTVPITFGTKPTNPSLFTPSVSPPFSSIFSEHPITSKRHDNLPRERDIPARLAARRNGQKRKSIHLPKIEQGWKGRKYSINQSLKSRHLTIEVLERRISHGELLSMQLNADARRDAITIGGTVGDVGGGTALMSPVHAKRHDKINQLMTGTASNIDGAGSARLNVPRKRARSRSSARDGLGAVGPQGHVKRRRKDLSETRATGRMLETGRYGLGGITLWRVIRVGAVVGEGETSEQHVALWCVPDKAMGGYF